MIFKTLEKRFEEAVVAAICKQSKHPTQIDIARELLSAYAHDIVKYVESFDDNTLVGRKVALQDFAHMVKMSSIYCPPFEEGERVVVKMNAGFHKGAHGVIKFVEPSGNRVWVIRDGASTPVWYSPMELERE